MENIPVVLLFIISLAACLAGTMIKNHYSKVLSDSMIGYHLYNALTAIVCSLTLLALSGGKLSVSPFTVLLAVIFGLVTVVQQVANAAAEYAEAHGAKSEVSNFAKAAGRFLAANNTSEPERR